MDDYKHIQEMLYGMPEPKAPDLSASQAALIVAHGYASADDEERIAHLLRQTSAKADVSGEDAADEARVWEALNAGLGMAESMHLPDTGDYYSTEDWKRAKAGYRHLLAVLRSQLDGKEEGR